MRAQDGAGEISVKSQQPRRGGLPAHFKAKGHPGRGGRPKGRRNTRTIVQQVLLGKAETLELLAKGDGKKLKPRHVRIGDLLRTASPQVRVQLERALMDHDWGKAKETLELSGNLDLNTVILEASARAKAAK